MHDNDQSYDPPYQAKEGAKDDEEELHDEMVLCVKRSNFYQFLPKTSSHSRGEAESRKYICRNGQNFFDQQGIVIELRTLFHKYAQVYFRKNGK